ncbi:type 4a pilus biogenesis protein PilO [bacterium]|nr:type 4a pilus biogenesis protein PilO [bacterium]
MNVEAIMERLEKIPIALIVFAYLLYVSYDVYDFTSSSSSPYNTRKARMASLESENVNLQKRVQEIDQFVKNLEAKRAELRTLAKNLEDMRATLTDTLDVPAFMKLFVDEGKKVGLTITSLRPDPPSDKDNKGFYGQRGFVMTFKGIYVQVMSFFRKISAKDRILRIDDFSLEPAESNLNRFVVLNGAAKVNAFYYQGSKEDEIAKKVNANVPVMSIQATPDSPTPPAPGAGAAPVQPPGVPPGAPPAPPQQTPPQPVPGGP